MPASDFERTYPYFSVELHGHADAASVIRIAGEIDLDNSTDMGVELEKLITAEPAGRISLDLTELTYIGSAGIREFLRCHDVAEQCGRRLEISQAHDNVRQVIDICGLSALFRLPTSA